MMMIMNDDDNTLKENYMGLGEEKVKRIYLAKSRSSVHPTQTGTEQ